MKIHRVIKDVDALQGDDDPPSGATLLLALAESGGSGDDRVDGSRAVDEYLYGSARRISQEGPVMVIEVVSDEFKPGGAANVANNLRSLGARMACSKCGRRGAEVRPDWSSHTSHMQPGVDVLTRRWGPSIR